MDGRQTGTYRCGRTGAEAVHLTYREMEERDFEACFALMQDRKRYSEDERAALPGIWRRWRKEEAMNAAVMEWQEGTAPPHVIFFGMSVFVTDQFLADARNSPTPHLSSTLLRWVMEGRSPTLDLPAVRAANSGDGLNLVINNFGFAWDEWPPEQLALILSRGTESFFWLLSGYNLREILVEYYDRRSVQFALAGGFLLRSDRRGANMEAGSLLSADDQSPCCVGITAEEALASPGSAIAKLFPYHRPSCLFSSGEQKVLLQALLDHSDEEIAALLDVSLSTVKKRWTGIYDCVFEQQPEILPEALWAAGQTQQKRGQEKRRHLLSYLRLHPQELRPYSRKKAPA